MTSSPPFEIESEYDLVIAGGGAAACVIAGRLARADPTLRILMLEAGPPTRENLQHVQPARYLSHLLPTSDTVRFHMADPSEATGSRPIVVPCGQCMGGGGSINFTMYTRPSASDYDDWEKVYGNAGWGSKELIPLLAKAETYQPGGNSTHGVSGPLKGSFGGAFTNVGQAFLDTARAMDPRRDGGDHVDANDLTTVNQYAKWPKWINKDDGRRSDTAHSYVYNLVDSNSNLQVVTGARVVRVTFEGDRADGVQFVWNSRYWPEADQGVQSVRARRLVLLSAGAFGSPGILERSGIGREDVLKHVDVPMKVNLPGVGESYQDHNLILIPYISSSEADTLDTIVRTESSQIDASAPSKEWLATGQGLMANNGIDSGVKWRPFDDELPALGPEFRKRWDSFFVPSPDKPVTWIGQGSLFFNPDPNFGITGKYFTMGAYTEYPIARGHVHITDATDPAARLDFKSGFLEDYADVVPLIWAYKYGREIARRMPYYRGELSIMHPPFADDSPARVVTRSEGPLAREEPAIVYTPEDEVVLEKFIRSVVSTTWHSLGTCAMKPRKDGGVVDSALNVYGVQGLKIADMSIAPGNVGANTFSTAVAIGEKAALIIAEELGLKGDV